MRNNTIYTLEKDLKKNWHESNVYPNVGEVKVAYKLNQELQSRPVINSIEDAYGILHEVYDRDTIGMQEQFIVLYLNRNNKLIGSYAGFFGGITSTVVDVKIIINVALKVMASGIIVSHNHPSGNMHASDMDNKLNEKIKNAAHMFDIQLLDHVLVGPEGDYCSILI